MSRLRAWVRSRQLRAIRRAYCGPPTETREGLRWYVLYLVAAGFSINEFTREEDLTYEEASRVFAEWRELVQR